LYSANAVQLPAKAHSTPPPTVHPDGVELAFADAMPGTAVSV
jgi:hypothetical protein